MVLYVSGRNKEMIKRGLKRLLAVAAVAGIAYAVYRYFTPDYLDDFDDEDFEDEDFDDDFEDEDIEK